MRVRHRRHDLVYDPGHPVLRQGLVVPVQELPAGVELQHDEYLLPVLERLQLLLDIRVVQLAQDVHVLQERGVGLARGEHLLLGLDVPLQCEPLDQADRHEVVPGLPPDSCLRALPPGELQHAVAALAQRLHHDVPAVGEGLLLVPPVEVHGLVPAGGHAPGQAPHEVLVPSLITAELREGVGQAAQASAARACRSHVGVRRQRRELGAHLGGACSHRGSKRLLLAPGQVQRLHRG
mmetsp:Transcript_71802/g.187182  ORF Transcript_71802/g.187182 Transcript_71802/m.187182 type:complete len:236 (+) Transcript_71802:1206-1913(+)